MPDYKKRYVLVFLMLALTYLSILILSIVVLISTIFNQKKLSIQILKKFLVFFKFLCTRFCGLKVEIKNYPQKSTIYVANHPSMIDALILLSFEPNFGIILKNNLLENQLIFFLAKVFDWPSAKDINLIERLTSNLKAGRPILIFPEGTRSPENKIGQFSRGAATLALRSGYPIGIIKISCNPPILNHLRHWAELPKGSIQYRIEIDEKSEYLDSNSTTEKEEAIKYTKKLSKMFGLLER